MTARTANRAERRAAVKHSHATRAEWAPWESRPETMPHATKMGDIRGCYLNNRYSVQVYARAIDIGEALHLVIRRHDGAMPNSWVDMQRIKNELVGPERVGVQVFPSESELVDLANLAHVFVYPEGHEIPFTIKGRWA